MSMTPSRRISISLPVPSSPPSRPHGKQTARSMPESILNSVNAWTTVSTPRPAAVAAGSAGVADQRQALDHHREFSLELLARAVMGVAVIDADGGRDPIFAALGAPAAAERAEAG